MSVSTAMEKTRLSLAHCGKVVFAQFTEMLNPCLNRGLPPSAAATDPSLNYYAKGLDIAAAAYVAELNYLANPVSVHCVAAEMMNQSINSLALISARMTGSALDVLSLVRDSPLRIQTGSPMHVTFAAHSLLSPLPLPMSRYPSNAERVCRDLQGSRRRAHISMFRCIPNARTRTLPDRR